jgi:Zn-dependent M28 family amino/carboxypeptidase
MIKLLIILSALAGIESDVAELCKTSRVSGSVNCQRAAQFITKRLKDNSYTVEQQEFAKNDFNIVAFKGDISQTNKTIVIGAHYDTVSTTLGADDNASGTTGVLHLADKLKDVKTKHQVIFILFGDEESGMVGSRYYVNNPVSPLKNIKVMVNMDMIGNLSSSWADSPTIDSVLDELFPRYPFAKSITFRAGERTDSLSFFNKRVPVIWLFTGTHNRYHRSTDTPDSLNYAGMTSILKYAYDFIIKLDGMTKVNYDNLYSSLPEKP